MMHYYPPMFPSEYITPSPLPPPTQSVYYYQPFSPFMANVSHVHHHLDALQQSRRLPHMTTTAASADIATMTDNLVPVVEQKKTTSASEILASQQAMATQLKAVAASMAQLSAQMQSFLAQRQEILPQSTVEQQQTPLLPATRTVVVSASAAQLLKTGQPSPRSSVDEAAQSKKHLQPRRMNWKKRKLKVSKFPTMLCRSILAEFSSVKKGSCGGSNVELLSTKERFLGDAHQVFDEIIDPKAEAKYGVKMKTSKVVVSERVVKKGFTIFEGEEDLKVELMTEEENAWKVFDEKPSSNSATQRHTPLVFSMWPTIATSCASAVQVPSASFTIYCLGELNVSTRFSDLVDGFPYINKVFDPGILHLMRLVGDVGDHSCIADIMQGAALLESLVKTYSSLAAKQIGAVEGSVGQRMKHDLRLTSQVLIWVVDPTSWSSMLDVYAKWCAVPSIYDLSIEVPSNVNRLLIFMEIPEHGSQVHNYSSEVLIILQWIKTKLHISLSDLLVVEKYYECSCYILIMTFTWSALLFKMSTSTSICWNAMMSACVLHENSMGAAMKIHDLAVKWMKLICSNPLMNSYLKYESLKEVKLLFEKNEMKNGVPWGPVTIEYEIGKYIQATGNEDNGLGGLEREETYNLEATNIMIDVFIMHFSNRKSVIIWAHLEVIKYSKFLRSTEMIQSSMTFAQAVECLFGRSGIISMKQEMNRVIVQRHKTTLAELQAGTLMLTNSVWYLVTLMKDENLVLEHVSNIAQSIKVSRGTTIVDGDILFKNKSSQCTNKLLLQTFAVEYILSRVGRLAKEDDKYLRKFIALLLGVVTPSISGLLDSVDVDDELEDFKKVGNDVLQLGFTSYATGTSSISQHLHDNPFLAIYSLIFGDVKTIEDTLLSSGGLILEFHLAIWWATSWKYAANVSAEEGFDFAILESKLSLQLLKTTVGKTNNIGAVGIDLHVTASKAYATNRTCDPNSREENHVGFHPNFGHALINLHTFIGAPFEHDHCLLADMVVLLTTKVILLIYVLCCCSLDSGRTTYTKFDRSRGALYDTKGEDDNAHMKNLMLLTGMKNLMLLIGMALLTFGLNHE